MCEYDRSAPLHSGNVRRPKNPTTLVYTDDERVAEFIGIVEFVRG